MICSKKSQQISIHFLVVFILAVVMFGLGVMLIWRIFFSSSDVVNISQAEFDKKIFALNCKPSEVVCIGANKVEINPGESVMISLKIFNNHNAELSYDVSYELMDSSNELLSQEEEETFQLLPLRYSSEVIPAKQDKELDVLLKTSKRLPEGDYSLRIKVSPTSLDTDIYRRVHIEVN